MDTSTTDFAENAADTRTGSEMYNALRQNSAEDAATAKTTQLESKVAEASQGAMQGVLSFLAKGGKDPAAMFTMAYAAFKFLDASMLNAIHKLGSGGPDQPAESTAEAVSLVPSGRGVTASAIALKLGQP